jgi:hypothetical protein
MSQESSSKFAVRSGARSFGGAAESISREGGSATLKPRDPNPCFSGSLCRGVLSPRPHRGYSCGRCFVPEIEADFLSARDASRAATGRAFARVANSNVLSIQVSYGVAAFGGCKLVRGDLRKAVEQLKRESGRGLLTGGATLPLALAEMGLIDEYEFILHPRIAGHGPTLLAGLSMHIDLKLVSQLEFGSGAMAMRYEPRR